MNEVDKQEDVVIWRPFLNITKDTIYKYANNFSIPYFKDTTPNWSMRGRMRCELFPVMKEIFGKTVLERFCNLSNKVSYLSNLHINCLIEPIKEKIKVSSYHNYRGTYKQCAIPIPKNTISDEGWEILIRYAYSKISRTHLRNKCLTPILNTLNRANMTDCSTQVFTLTGGSRARVSFNEIILYDYEDAKIEQDYS